MCAIRIEPWLESYLISETSSAIPGFDSKELDDICAIKYMMSSNEAHKSDILGNSNDNLDILTHRWERISRLSFLVYVKFTA